MSAFLYLTFFKNIFFITENLKNCKDIKNILKCPLSYICFSVTDVSFFKYFFYHRKVKKWKEKDKKYF